MNKNRVILLFAAVAAFMFLAVFVSAEGEKCFQETANVSTACGGLDTGVYDIGDSSDWNSNPSVLYDGDYATSTFRSGTTATFLINYTKIPNSLSAVWTIKGSNPRQNESIPESCFSHFSDVVSLRAISQSGGASWSCFDGTWNTLVSDSGTDSISEESITWNSSISLETQLNTPTNATKLPDSIKNFNATVKTFTGLNLQNATLHLWYSNGTLFNTSTNTISGTGQNTTIFRNIAIDNVAQGGSGKWNVLGRATNSTGDLITEWASANFTFNRQGVETASDFSDTAVQTAREKFIENITIPPELSIDSATLWWNNIDKGGTSNKIAGNNYTLSTTFDIPLINDTVGFYWNVTYSTGEVQQFSNKTQQVLAANLSLCSAGNDIEYLNLTFKNETAGQEQINAILSSISADYYLGSGSVNKSLDVSSTNEKVEHTFCFSPSDKTINSTLSLRYTNTDSEQRKYNPSLLSLSNSTKNTTLFLLPTAEGLFVTFQIINPAEQPISGAQISSSRENFDGIIGSESTDDAGTATFFLDPDATYTVTVQKSGFSTLTKTINPSTSEFTLTLGGRAVKVPQDNLKGTTYSIHPQVPVLANGTDYEFNLTINNTDQTIEKYGFTLVNDTGDVIGAQNDTSNTGGIVNVTANTGSSDEISLNAFWTISGNTTQINKQWIVRSEGDRSYSITNLGDDLVRFIDNGMFGLDNFGLRIIIFSAIFFMTAALSFKFGLTSPAAIVSLITVFTAFFDVGLGLFPNPVGAVPHLPTIFMSLITLMIVFREATR